MVTPLDLQNAEVSQSQHHLILPLYGLYASFCHSLGRHNATINRVAGLELVMFAIKRALKLNNSEATLTRQACWIPSCCLQHGVKFASADVQ